MPRTPDERHPCRCRCDCDWSAAGERCYLCSEGFCRPSRAVRRVLNARLELWSSILAELTPDSSSGISVAALREAISRYDVRAKAIV